MNGQYSENKKQSVKLFDKNAEKESDSQLNIFILARMSNIWYEKNPYFEVGGYK